MNERVRTFLFIAAYVLAMALVGLAVLSMGGCGPKDETLTCKDGTFTSGEGARAVCAQHGGVA